MFAIRPQRNRCDAILRRFLGSLSCIALCGALVLSGAARDAAAATINVDSVQDPNTLADGIGGGCTLRKALSNAVAGAQTFTDCTTGSAGADIITFSSSAAITMGTIGAFPDVNKDITLTGPKTITGNGSDSIFRVASSGTLTLTGFTLTDAGNSAIRMAGLAHLKVDDSAFNGNTTGACCGGAIGGNGTIALKNVTFDSNTAPSGSGGAIHLSGADLSTITDASFTNNSANDDGGAIYVTLTGSLVSPANLTITNGLFASNKASASGGATSGGGALHARASGVAFVTLLNATFINNEVDGNDGRGGAIYNGQADAYPMIVDHVVFTLNKLTSNAAAMGAAIYNAGNIVVRASSFILNDAGTGMGGAIASDAAPPDGGASPPEPGAVIANSTIQGNAAGIGGGIYSFASSGSRELNLVNVTLDGNTATGAGGGIRTENISGGTAITRLANTIVSNNIGGGIGENCSNNVPANVVDNVVTNLQFPGATCPANVAITTGDPALDAPFINPPDVLTLTMSLNAGSAASSAGDNATCAAFPILNLDQRSLVVPIRPLGGSNCDIGAYESDLAPGYGSAPAPGATITINTLSGVPAMSDVVISETGSDSLIISSYSVGGNPEVTVSGPVAPFTILDGGGTQTLTLTCSSAVPFSTSVTLTVNHSATGSPATYTVNCTVVDPLTITTATPMPDGTVGTPYSQTFAASGGTAPYVNWAVTAGALPPVLTLDAPSGGLTGTPTTPGLYNFTIEVTDTNALTATKAFSLTINAAPVPPTITTATPLPGGTTGTPYTLTFAATGGTLPYTNWAVTAGALPPVLALTAATGDLTGTPTLAGIYNFTIEVTDSAPLTNSKAFSLTVIDPLVIATGSPLPVGTAGIAYSQTFTATGGTPPYVDWSVIAGALPPGLAVAAGTGDLTGMPTTPGTYNFTVQVTDNVALTSTKAFSLTINAALSITTATPLPTGTLGIAYSQTFAATGGTPPYVNWAVTAGALPPGLLLAAATGDLTGTPTVPGPYNFTIEVTDNVASTATKAFALTINASLAITTATPMPAGSVGVAYSQTFAATGGTPPYVNWAVTAGALPAGLTLAAATGALTGMPSTAVGSPFAFTIEVTDNVGGTATKAFTLPVNAALAITTATPLPAGAVGAAYSQTFAAAGGTPPYVNWAVTVGALPAGLALDATTGALTGMPSTAVGSPFAFTIQVTDNIGGMATKAFTLPINAAAACSSGPSGTGSGTVQACVAGGGATCAFAPGSAVFIPLTGHPLSPPAGTAPAGIVFPHGLFAFTLAGCTPGSSVTLTLTYPSAIAAGAQYWKYGPQPPAVPAGWYILPATIVGNTATFTIADGGLGDDDLVANGTIVDQGGPGVPGAPGVGGVIQTPTLSEWALLLLALLILGAGMGRIRRRGA